MPSAHQLLELMKNQTDERSPLYCVALGDGQSTAAFALQELKPLSLATTGLLML